MRANSKYEKPVIQPINESPSPLGLAGVVIAAGMAFVFLINAFVYTNAIVTAVAGANGVVGANVGYAANAVGTVNYNN